jgi:hypothetical protein
MRVMAMVMIVELMVMAILLMTMMELMTIFLVNIDSYRLGWKILMKNK